MKKYNIPIYLKYKQEVEEEWEDVNKPINGDYTGLTNNEIVINFLPLVENIARKQLGITEHQYNMMQHLKEVDGNQVRGDPWRRCTDCGWAGCG